MMSLRGGVLVALVAAFLAGAFRQARPAEAAVPNPCPKWECKNVYSWIVSVPWQVQAAYQRGSQTVTTIYGWQNIFATTSSNQNSGTTTSYYDMPVFPYCSPTCGKSNGSFGPSWQGPQEVAPSGTAEFISGGQNQKQFICGTVAGDGVLGPKPADQWNYNNDDTDPPGWTG
jgi:hypothetical protein